MYFYSWKTCRKNFEVGVKEVIETYVDIIFKKDIFPDFIA
jgi:hypothetical protein